jgi:hypothetical protein
MVTQFDRLIDDVERLILKHEKLRGPEADRTGYRPRISTIG